jgi:hypothetical protein
MRQYISYVQTYVIQNWNIKIARRSFEIISQFKYFGMAVISQNFIWAKLRGDLILGLPPTTESRTFVSRLLSPPPPKKLKFSRW